MVQITMFDKFSGSLWQTGACVSDVASHLFINIGQLTEQNEKMGLFWFKYEARCKTARMGAETLGNKLV